MPTRSLAYVYTERRAAGTDAVPHNLHPLEELFLAIYIYIHTSDSDGILVSEGENVVSR